MGLPWISTQRFLTSSINHLLSNSLGLWLPPTFANRVRASNQSADRLAGLYFPPDHAAARLALDLFNRHVRPSPLSSPSRQRRRSPSTSDKICSACPITRRSPQARSRSASALRPRTPSAIAAGRRGRSR